VLLHVPGTVPLYRLPASPKAETDAVALPPPARTEAATDAIAHGLKLGLRRAGTASTACGSSDSLPDIEDEEEAQPSVCPPTDLGGAGEEPCAAPTSSVTVSAQADGDAHIGADPPPSSPEDAAAAAAGAVLARIAGFVRGVRGDGDGEDGSAVPADDGDDAAAMAARALLARMRMRRSERGLRCGLPYEGSAACRRKGTKDGAPRRSVKFDLSSNVVHEVTPYSEIYGLHPREFVFGRDFCVVPAGGDYGFVDMRSAARGSKAADDSDEESERGVDSDSDDEGVEQGGANAKVEVRLQDRL